MEISIRQLSKSDAGALHAAVSESVEHLSPWLPWCTPHYSMQDANDWAGSAAQSWRDGTDYRFLIEDSATGRFLGSVGINQVVAQHRRGNLGYWVRSSELNRGICTRAARLAVLFAFEKLGFQRMEIHVLTDNDASNAVAAKLGGVYEGTFRNKLVNRGQSLPAKCYSVIPADYETRRDSGHPSAVQYAPASRDKFGATMKDKE
ncbi:MAG: GNAT family protein [Halioglobus sp.]